MRKLRLIIASVASLLLLTACGDIVGTSDTGASDMNDQLVTDSPWQATVDASSDGGEAGMTCENLETARSGEKISCFTYFDIANVSTMPQELHGYYYIVSDGITYLSNSGYENSKAINPQDSVGRVIAFQIPFGSIVSGMYMAESPDGAHMWDMPLNVEIRR